MKLPLLYIFTFLTISLFGQSITQYEFLNNGNTELKVSSVFDSGSSSVFQDNSTINIFIPNGYTNPTITSLQGGSWFISATITNGQLVPFCGASANDYYMIAVSTGSIANLGSVVENTAEDLFTVAFSGTSSLPLIGYDPAGSDPLSACVVVAGVDNTASIDSDGNGPGPTIGYGQVPIAPLQVSLPVELVFFDATSQNKQINLRWKSASEIDFDGYEIQRTDNGRDFTPIAWVKGKGGFQEANYNYSDKDISPKKVYYYRLKMFDLNGSYEFSEVRSASIESAEETFSVYPNPIARNGSLTIENRDEEKMKFLLFNSTGQLLKEVFIEPEYVFTFQLQDMAAGFLIYKIKSTTGLKSGKIIVQ